ncbi:7865_t:CDS:1, partial [Funneliformis caledonium]
CFQSDEKLTSLKNNESLCKWNEDAIKSLLAYLKDNKDKVVQLKSRGIIVREPL